MDKFLDEYEALDIIDAAKQLFNLPDDTTLKDLEKLSSEQLEQLYNEMSNQDSDRD